MASYKYTIITPEGKRKTGTLDAVSEDAAASSLRMAGNTIVELGAASIMERDLDIHIGKVVKPRELSIFCRQFQSVLKAGVTVLDALDMLEEQQENKAFKRAIGKVHDDVQKGSTLAAAMEEHPKIFPEIMVHMTNAGEASGSLDVAFDRLATYFEKSARISGLVAKSMVYPVILILVIIVVVIIMMVKIVPTFTDTFNEIGGELPGITKAVIAISDALVSKGYVLAIIVALIVFFLREFKKTPRGSLIFGQLGLKLPLVGNLTIKNASAQLARTLSTLMASGITMVDGVAIVEKIMKNYIVKNVLKKAEKDIMEGIPLSVPLAESGVFPPMVHHMIKIGEETGNIEEMLDKIADYYEEEVEMATESLLAALEPLIIVAMALVVVPIILAIMLPMFSLQNAIDQQ